ncbi:MAG: hypothetical protein HC836_44215 [Richelia sp. RM2_1_2]|nr:hypothetical protein [Richelia sp. RM2_1_2]
MKLCKNCGGEIGSSKDYRNVFCTRSCSVAFNNVGRKNSEKTKKIKSIKLLEWCSQNNKNIVHSKKCKCCGNEFSYGKSNKKGRTYCSVLCRKKDRSKHLNDKKKYRVQCRFLFNVFDYPNEFNLELVKKYGFYSASNRGNNLNGISRDHIYSINDGFKNQISYELISHPANCRLVQQTENSKKHTKSLITIDELVSRIRDWNKKYGSDAMACTTHLQ